MTNLVPTQAPGALAEYNGEMLIGFEGFVTSGPPPVQRLILINSTKQMGDHEGSQFGEFFDEATGQSYKELDLFLVSINTHRAWLPDYDPNADEQVIYCRSRNGIRPDPEYVGARAQELGIPADKVACAACPHGQWKDKKIDCPDSYRLIAWMPDGTPRVIDARGTSAGPAKKYAQSFQMKGLNLFALRTKITPQKMSNGNTYFVMAFAAQSDKPVTPEEKEAIVTFYKNYAKGFLEAAANRDTEVVVPENYTGGQTIDTTATTPPAGPAPQTDLF